MDMYNIRQVITVVLFCTGSGYNKTEEQAASSPYLDRTAALEEGRLRTTPSSMNTFSVEQPPAGTARIAGVSLSCAQDHDARLS